MPFDLYHALATVAALFLLIFILEHFVFTPETSKGKRITIGFVAVFVVIFCLNLLWPALGGAGSP